MISNRNLCHFFSLWLVLFFMSCNNKYDNIKEGQIIFTKGKESGGEVWVPRTKYRIFIINKIIDSLVLLNEIEPFYFSLYEKNNPIKEPWGDDQKKLFEILRKNIDTITITRFSHDDLWENPLDKENSEYYDYYIDHKFIKKHPQMLYSTLHYVDFTQKEKDTMNLLEYDTYFIALKMEIL